MFLTNSVASRLYLKVVSAVLIRDECESIAELSEAAKCECLRLGLPIDSLEVSRAIEIMRERLDRDLPIRLTPPAQSEDEARDQLTRAEAAEAYRRFARSAIHAMPPTDWRDRDPRAAARYAAILEEIAATIARCEKLEHG